jgi:hypothetical protein
VQTILRFFIIFLFFPVLSEAQQYSTLRTLKIKTGADTIRLDSFSIQPKSLRFITGKSDSSAYRFLPFDGLLIKNPGAQTSGDSITLKFRVLPYSFSEPFRNKDRRLSTAEERGVYNPFVFTPSLKDKNALQFKGPQQNRLNLQRNLRRKQPRPLRELHAQPPTFWETIP